MNEPDASDASHAQMAHDENAVSQHHDGLALAGLEMPAAHSADAPHLYSADHAGLGPKHNASPSPNPESVALPDDASFSSAGPPSEPPGDSILSLENSRLDVDDTAYSVMENNTRRNLMDMESSFLPEQPSSPAPAHAGPEEKGVDDTYLFAGSPGNTKDRPALAIHDANGLREHRASSLRVSSPAPHSAMDGNEHPHEEDVTTSPAAAAAWRAQVRTNTTDVPELGEKDAHIAASIEHGDEVAHGEPAVEPRFGSRSIAGPEQSSSLPQDAAGAEHAQQQIDSTQATGEVSNTIRSTRAAPLRSSLLTGRPSYLRSRQASARSSTSSFAGKSDTSEATLGAESALQSSGVQPLGSTNGVHGTSLSRLPSFSSVASGVSSNLGDSQLSWNRSKSSAAEPASLLESNGLEPLDEETQSTKSQPATPTAFGYNSAAPTDTVIAQHVRNIKVPETVAREYREKHLGESPERRRMLGQSTTRKNNLTLKEQNSKIDKLSKENFDLKLKIHFLDQALQNRSDEGVKEMINKNVQLQTDLANEKKENQSMKRKIRDLERKVKLQEEGALAQHPVIEESDDDKSDRSAMFAEMEEEFVMMREVVQQHEAEIERLRDENLAKEVDKRRLADYIKVMGENKTSEPAGGVEEALEMWRDLLEAETARREQADEDATKLRDEIKHLKAEAAMVAISHMSTRNDYNPNKRHPDARAENGLSDPRSDINGTSHVKNGALMSQNETLRHENAELRRDLSAQTQMLTSRNRERERLQQEIEELKLHHRRGGADGVRSVAGDSIFERSVSCAGAHGRSSSRASGATRVTQISDHERDEYEKKQATLRDELAQVKMTNQDLERELNAHLDILQTAEAENRGLKEEKDLTDEDLRALQSERDEALLSLQDKEEELEALREEAISEIETLERELEQKEADFATLQTEMKTVSEAVVRLEDELQISKRKEQTLEQQLEDNEGELEALDKKLRDTIEKNERLDVQLESSQGEIAFLREEQDADKLKIGELESALNTAQASIQDAKDTIGEMEEQYTDEKGQREILDDQEKHNTQQMLDNLNSQLVKSREEVRKLRKSLSGKEQEAASWKERLETLEANLKEALGDVYDTKSSILKVSVVSLIWQVYLSNNQTGRRQTHSRPGQHRHQSRQRQARTFREGPLVAQSRLSA